MKFSHGEYFDMLRLYEAYSDKAKGKDVVREAACAWLKQEFNAVGNGKPLYNYQRWYMLGEEKQKLTIGGIFPITGDKFNAPELLPGELLQVLVDWVLLTWIWDVPPSCLGSR